MISVEILAKNFGTLTAVDSISFHVNEGELFGFLGPNGAGKTTTLSMMAGLLRPDNGSITINEINVWESPKEAKKILGLVPQELAIYEELTGRENLHFWGGFFNLSKKELKENTNEWLKRVGLEEKADKSVSTYSGGMKRRLNLAVGLIHKPKVVFMDEPTVGIDPQARNNILDIIREIANTGTTIIFTTHHLEEAESLCERIAIMDHGKMLQIGTVVELAKVVGDGDLVTITGEFTPNDVRTPLQHEQINIISTTQDSATLSLVPGGATIATLVQRLAENNIEITDISVEKPNLEKVFLKLTGRELRD